MPITQLPVGLKKQTEGDLDWETGLNSGMDDANTRLTLQGTANPNTPGVAGSWVGQLYQQSVDSNTYFNMWICRTAGPAGTALWIPMGPQWNALGDYFEWFDWFGGPQNRPFGRPNQFFFEQNAIVSGVAATPLTSSPQPTMLTRASGGFTAFFVIGWAQMTGASRTLQIQERTWQGPTEGTPTWAGVTPGFPSPGTNQITTAFYARLSQSVGGADDSRHYRWRLGSDAADSMFCGMMAWSVSLLGAATTP